MTNSITFITEEGTIPSQFKRLTELPVMIVVGLTGVGKSTTLSLLPRKGLSFTLLPNRRRITDEIIIASQQREAGQKPHLVRDRVQRFQYTAQYRAKFSGGVAHALSQVALDTEHLTQPIIFDGLRGLDEIKYACNHFSQARFVVLEAPDIVRLERILGRGDSFDSTELPISAVDQDICAALQSVPNIDAIFEGDLLDQVVKIATMAQIPAETVIKKVSIIIEERRNYDSRTARVHLTRRLPAKRVLVIDTTASTPESTAQKIVNWLR